MKCETYMFFHSFEAAAADILQTHILDGPGCSAKFRPNCSTSREMAAIFNIVTIVSRQIACSVTLVVYSVVERTLLIDYAF